MKYTCFLVLLLLNSACENWTVKKISSEEILNEELQTFKWNEVDAYPAFSACDSLETRTEKKTCFETMITNHLSTYLSSQKFVVSQDINDTLELEFLISDKGVVTIGNIKVKEATLAEIPELKKVLASSLDSLPKVFPAIKRGQQVNSQFTMPVVVSVN